MKYTDLPKPRPDTVLPGGGRILARQPVLWCRDCDTEYSANPRDYWDCTGEARCGPCDAPLVLVDVLRVVVPADETEAVRRAERAAWETFDEIGEER